jgi:lysozyme
MNRITKLDERGRQELKKHEALRLQAYRCPAGVWTIGWGLTFYPDGRRVRPGDIATIDEANRYFDHVLSSFEQGVDNMTRDDITQNQFNALVSFAYNMGLTALRHSTLLSIVNKDPNDPAIAEEFKKWVHAGGKKLNGLIKRRKEEAEMYFEK